MNCKEKKKRASFSLRRTLSPLLRHMNRHAVLYMQAPFVILFLLFIIIPVVIAIGISFTDFNSIEKPNFVGLENYVNILTNDNTFTEFAIPNTIVYSVIVGVGG